MITIDDTCNSINRCRFCLSIEDNNRSKLILLPRSLDGFDSDGNTLLKLYEKFPELMPHLRTVHLSADRYLFSFSSNMSNINRLNLNEVIEISREIVKAGIYLLRGFNFMMYGGKIVLNLNDQIMARSGKEVDIMSAISDFCLQLIEIIRYHHHNFKLSRSPHYSGNPVETINFIQSEFENFINSIR